MQPTRETIVRWIGRLALIVLAACVLPAWNCGFNGPSSGADEWEEVDQSCDFHNALNPDPDCDFTEADAAPQDGCPHADRGWHYCGRCETRVGAECQYCAETNYCSANPCDAYCGPRVDSHRCPSTHPVSDGRGHCCPDSHPVYCSETEVCGRTSWDCEVEPPPGPGGGTCSSSPTYCGPCECIRSCGDSLGNGWYESCSGLRSRTCAATDMSCVNIAFDEIVEWCSC